LRFRSSLLVRDTDLQQAMRANNLTIKITFFFIRF
jgi:hypothetical protein